MEAMQKLLNDSTIANVEVWIQNSDCDWVVTQVFYKKTRSKVTEDTLEIVNMFENGTSIMHDVHLKSKGISWYDIKKMTLHWIARTSGEIVETY